MSFLNISLVNREEKVGKWMGLDGSRACRKASGDAGERECVCIDINGLWCVVCQLAQAWLCIPLFTVYVHVSASTNSPCQLWRLFINFLLRSLGETFPVRSVFCWMCPVQRGRSLSGEKHPTETSLTYHIMFWLVLLSFTDTTFESKTRGNK